MSSSSGLTFKLHPLVIVNIADHHTRVKAQSNGSGPGTATATPPTTATATVTGTGTGTGTGAGTPPTAAGGGGGGGGGDGGSGGAIAVGTAPSAAPRVFGCLLGVQTGRTVEIFNSFELKYDAAMECPDRPFLETKQEQYKKVFPKYDVLGWYATGSDVQDSDMLFHKALMDINESPIYILLNPAINHVQKDLPITLYESELHIIDGVPSLIFVKSSYTIETVEAERISVDHVAHIKPSDGSTAATQLAAHLTGMHSAIKMLNSRIKVLHHHLVSIQNGEVPYEHSLLRQISSLVRRLPAIDSPKFHDDFLMEYNDTLLMTYLATITKCSSTINELVDKFNVAYDKQSRRGGRTTFI